jgi:hypothetical protein
MAQQAAIATTLPATGVTTTSAVLNGRVDTGGHQAEWQFEYGTSTAYSQATPINTIPAGGGSVTVSASVTKLNPNTTYHFRLVAISGIGSAYLEIDHGVDLTFTTRPTGTLGLVSGRLIVSKGTVHVGLKCNSSMACGGRYSIDTRAKLVNHKIGTVLCATRSFTIPPNTTKSVNSRARLACLGLLRDAHGHKIKATFSSAPRTGQLGLVKRVTLVLR